MRIFQQLFGKPEYPGTYHVYVSDNYHYMMDDAEYKLGTFKTCDDATIACKDIVDGWLMYNYQPGMTAEALFNGYKQYGEDPWISSDDETCFFSAWTYAEEKSRMIADNADCEIC